jgi:hypothetical protein
MIGSFLLIFHLQNNYGTQYGTQQQKMSFENKKPL